MQHQPQKELSLGEQVNLAVGICQIISFPLLAFTRKPGTWGCRFAGLHALMGTLLMPVVIAYLDHSDTVAVPVFWATVAMFLVHRVAGWFWRPAGLHSRYLGKRWLPAVLEQLLPIGFGYFLMPASPGLGMWFMASGIALAVDDAYQRAWVRSQVRAINDGQAEQRMVRRLYEEEGHG